MEVWLSLDSRQKKRLLNRGGLTSCAPRITACLVTTLPLQGQHPGVGGWEDQAAAILQGGSVSREGARPGQRVLKRAGAELRPSEGDRGQCEASPVQEGQERRSQRAKPVLPIPYQRPRGRAESRGNSGPRARAPARAPFKLRFCTSRPAPRRLEPARAAQPMGGALPPGARQWRRAFLGRARARLSPPPHPTPRTSLCVGSARCGLRARPHFASQSCAPGFFFFCGGDRTWVLGPEFCAVPAALLRGRDLPRRRAQPPGPASERARRRERRRRRRRRL